MDNFMIESNRPIKDGPLICIDFYWGPKYIRDVSIKCVLGLSSSTNIHTNTHTVQVKSI